MFFAEKCVPSCIMTTKAKQDSALKRPAEAEPDLESKRPKTEEVEVENGRLRAMLAGLKDSDLDL